jgi:hypothetical protein
MSEPRKPSRSDPLIDEIREIRKRISEAHGNDVRRLCEHLRELEARYPERIVRRSPKPRIPRV